MASPFPGMDPYLEDNQHWPSFHHLLTDEIMAQLNTILSDKYYADVEVRTVLEEIGIAATHVIYPDAAVLEAAPQAGAPAAPAPVLTAPIQRIAVPAEPMKYRAVRVYLAENKELVTAIEILSPVNKHGQGLDRYRQKRERVLRTNVHLVEVDLLREGQRPGWELIDPPLDTDYICLVNRASYGDDRISEIWPAALNEPLPTLPVPLLPPDPDVPLNLNEAVKNVYTRAAYARRIDYRQPIPEPALRLPMRAWLAEAKIGVSEP
jgi:hypothetical protein